jgi:hypothetical protein
MTITDPFIQAAETCHPEMWRGILETMRFKMRMTHRESLACLRQMFPGRCDRRPPHPRIDWHGGQSHDIAALIHWFGVTRLRRLFLQAQANRHGRPEGRTGSKEGSTITGRIL